MRQGQCTSSVDIFTCTDKINDIFIYIDKLDKVFIFAMCLAKINGYMNLRPLTL